MNLKTILTAVAAVFFLAFGQIAMANDSPEEFSAEIITVNVNEADAETIASTLVGIGFKRAQAIVDYREKHGRFYTAEELTAVKGVGQTTIEKNLSRITLK